METSTALQLFRAAFLSEFSEILNMLLRKDSIFLLWGMFHIISLSWRFMLHIGKSLKSSAKDVCLVLIQCCANLLVCGNFYSWSIC